MDQSTIDVDYSSVVNFNDSGNAVERERAHRAHFLSLGKGGLMTLISKSFDWNLCR